MEEKNKRKVRFQDDQHQSSTKKKSLDRSRPKSSPTTTTTTNEFDETESRLHRGKYALDSDEEDQDDLDEQKQMNEDDLNDMGQEKATIGFDDDVKITPFNIDEELEEGHYDQSGCFQWKKKDKDEIHDAWLDEIDWTNVKNYKLKSNSKSFEEENEDKIETNDDFHLKTFDEKSTLESMLKLMKPGETVTKTIKRFGSIISKTPKVKSKGKDKVRRLLPGEIPSDSMTTNEINEEDFKQNQLFFDQMSSLADQFVSNGDLDIYQETFEKLKMKFDQFNRSTSQIDSTKFDMFGDEEISSSVQKNQNNSNSTKEIRWEYLTDENDLKNLQGPFTTEQMIRLGQIEGKINRDKVRCRRQGTETFYSIKRIDFDLYLD